MFQSTPKLLLLLASLLSSLVYWTEPCQAVSHVPDNPLVIAYLAPWRMPQNGLRIADIPASQLTHIFYAFGKVSDEGLAALSDPCQT